MDSDYYPSPRRVPRSSIPRVVGILAIIFACIGLLASLIFTIGPISDLRRYGDDVGFVRMWMYLWGVLSFVLFAVHVAGGALAIGYRTIGLRMLTGYAIGAILLVVIDLALLNMYARDATSDARNYTLRDSVLYPHLMFSLLALPWPITVLALVRARGAKAACR